MSATALLGALIIGLSLGLTGAGGSILTVPLLVYLAGVPPREAVALSLLVVGSASLAGAWQRARSGDLHVPAVLWFSISGIIGAAIGARLTHHLPAEWLMAAFSILMIGVAARMLTRPPEAVEPAANCKPARCFLAGGMVGVFTGFLGVGGGFLLMPALQRFARLPIRMATGTSLAIITINSGAGFLSHFRQTSISWPLAAGYVGMAVLGVFAAGILSPRLSPRRLRLGFGGLTLTLGMAILLQVILTQQS